MMMRYTQQQMICVSMTKLSVRLLFHLNISLLLAIIRDDIHSKNLVADNNDDEIQTVPNDLFPDEKGICKTCFSLKWLCIITNYAK